MSCYLRQLRGSAKNYQNSQPKIADFKTIVHIGFKSNQNHLYTKRLSRTKCNCACSWRLIWELAGMLLWVSHSVVPWLNRNLAGIVSISAARRAKIKTNRIFPLIKTITFAIFKKRPASQKLAKIYPGCPKVMPHPFFRDFLEASIMTTQYLGQLQERACLAFFEAIWLKNSATLQSITDGNRDLLL